MRALRAAQLVLLLCLFAVGAPAVAIAGLDDAKVSYCLSAAQRSALRETAQALDLQPDADLAGWRRNKATDFNRACEALYGAQKTPQPEALTIALPFLTGVAGALLAFVAAAWWDRINRGRVLADALRLAVKEFHEEAVSFLDEWVPSKQHTELDAKRSRLEHQLAVVRSERRWWRKPRRMTAELTTGRFGQGMTAGWDVSNEQTRASQRQCAEGLTGLRNDLLTVSAALTSPLLGWWRAR